MATSISGRKKRGRPPTGRLAYLGFRASDQLAGAIDAFILSAGQDISRSEAIRCMLTDWLRTHGYLDLGNPTQFTGRATDLIKAMDAEEHRAKK